MADAGTTITPDQAAVKTVPVGVKVKILTVNRRAMTLAMFRQLPMENIIDRETAEFRGIPWGRVNYHPECPRKKYHVHVVWESEGTLKHACEYQFDIPRHRLYDELKKWLGAAVLAGTFREGWSRAEVEEIVATVKRELRCKDSVELPKELYDYWNAEKRAGERGAGLREHLDEIRMRSEACIDAVAWPGATGSEMLAERVQPLTNAILEFEAKWKAQYEALERLDQLFIGI